MNVQNPEEQFMREALKEAQAAAGEGEVSVGAVIVCGQRIIARAHNLTQRLLDPTAHAEMQAITAATHALGGKYLHDCTLVVTLEPCVMCAGALFWAQIGKIIYGAPDPKRGFTLLQKPLLHPKTVVESGLLQAECTQLLSDFFKQRR
jgi:tRNA(adenine34) deaminase